MKILDAIEDYKYTLLDESEIEEFS